MTDNPYLVKYANSLLVAKTEAESDGGPVTP